MGNTQANNEAPIPSRSLESVESGNVALNPAEYLVSPVGYRVLGVQSNSPCSNLGLVAFFDFIIAANGVPLRTLDTTFIELIKGSEDRALPLAVYNTKSHTLREVVVVPHRKWQGEGMLGLTIRFDDFRHADESVIHILEVEHDSPAEIAGLQANKDYLLGTAEKAFKDTEVLFQELQAHIDQPIEFFVYNVDSDEVRIVVIMPTEDWGGEGILGASVGHGYLHMLPASACETLGRSAETSGHHAANSAFGHNSTVSNPSMGALPPANTVGAAEGAPPAPPAAPLPLPYPNMKLPSTVAETERVQNTPIPTSS